MFILATSDVNLLSVSLCGLISVLLSAVDFFACTRHEIVNPVQSPRPSFKGGGFKLLQHFKARVRHQYSRDADAVFSLIIFQQGGNNSRQC